MNTDTIAALEVPDYIYDHIKRMLIDAGFGNAIKAASIDMRGTVFVRKPEPDDTLQSRISNVENFLIEAATHQAQLLTAQAELIKTLTAEVKAFQVACGLLNSRQQFETHVHIDAPKGLEQIKGPTSLRDRVGLGSLPRR